MNPVCDEQENVYLKISVAPSWYQMLLRPKENLPVIRPLALNIINNLSTHHFCPTLPFIS